MPEPFARAAAAGRQFRQGDAAVDAVVSASCRVLAGDRIALVGPSGGGKSTLLHLLAGLDAPTSGLVDWPALGRADELRPGKVSMVFQAPSLVPALSVIENVALPLILGGDAAQARKAAARMLERLGLDTLAEKLPQEISGGQAQRAALARALVGGPRLVLADEPTGQLDHATAQQLLDVLLQHLDETGAALVVATHDEAVATRLRTRWHMRHGRLDGPATQEAAA